MTKKSGFHLNRYENAQIKNFNSFADDSTPHSQPHENRYISSRNNMKNGALESKDEQNEDNIV